MPVRTHDPDLPRRRYEQKLPAAWKAARDALAKREEAEAVVARRKAEADAALMAKYGMRDN